jgi:tRNA-specific adenosine deaminase 1
MMKQQAMADHGNKTLPAVLTMLPDRISSCAIHHYHFTLQGNKGKPKTNEEWTVYAAIVAHHRADDILWVVSCGTGTKCTTQRQDGCVLHDAHAEVLARRGLIRVLWGEIIFMQQTKDASNDQTRSIRPLLVRSSISKCDSGTKYRLNPLIDLHLYISDSPCGDASIYMIPNEFNLDQGDSSNQETSHGVLGFTGAKIIVSQATGVTSEDCGGDHQLLVGSAAQNEFSQDARRSRNVDSENGRNETKQQHACPTVVAREDVQITGKLRTKSGRSNLPDQLRSTSMSCSDKIALWGVMGLQGALLTSVLDPPVVRLTSVVVSRDPRISVDRNYTIHDNHQLEALQRAIPCRCKVAIQCLQASLLERASNMNCEFESIPAVHVVSHVFASGKAAMSSALTGSKTSLSGKKRKLENSRTDSKVKMPPCGVAFNWNKRDADMELVVGVRGIQQGRKPKTPLDYQKLSSRLCRAQVAKLVMAKMRAGVIKLKEGWGQEATSGVIMYQKLKTALALCEWNEVKTKLFCDENSPFVGWIRNNKEDDFEL